MTRDSINAKIQGIFDRVGIHPDGPGEEAFWNAVDEVELVDAEAAAELSDLSDAWEHAKG